MCGTRSFTKFFRDNNFEGFHWEGGEIANQLFHNLKNGKTYFDENFEGPFPNKQGSFYAGMEDDTDLILQQNKGASLPWDKLEASKLFKELDISYPGSLFILNTRNDWVERKTKEYLKNDRYKMLPDGIVLSDLSNWWAKDQQEHFENVRNYFQNRNDFLDYNIQEDDSSKIVNWLSKFNIEIKNTTFPQIR